MELFRLHAYSVSPGRTSRTAVPRGGSVRLTTELRSILAETTSAARFEARTSVDFDIKIKGNARSNEMRDRILEFSFGKGMAVKAAALAIASHLSQAMDLRSAACLLVLTAMKQNDRRRVTLWIFPRDKAFRLGGNQTSATIQILSDIFSQTSKLRKAAMFDGRNLRSEFLQGRVLDFQAKEPSLDVADFWIGRFLQCTLSINDEAGTRMLATAIKKAVKSCSDVHDQEQILTAAMAIRTSPKRRWSLEQFATEYLSGAARECFDAEKPNSESYTSLFDFRREEFESSLAYRVYTLKSGVLVSSPLSEIGRSVHVTGDRDRRLACEGIIESEKVRATRG